LNEWRKLGEPGLKNLTPSFVADEDGWAVRPRLGGTA
jgi:hypothetical protein